jgi:GNAT superfamily N-acetyltransferase
MAKMELREFMKDSKKEGKMSDIMDLKSVGKLVVWLHPKSGIESRKVHYLPMVKDVEVKKGKKTITEKQVTSQFVICSGFDDCPIDQFKSALRKDDNYGDDDVIFEVGEGKNKVEYTKGDILGVEGYDWRHNIRTITEYLFGAIDKDSIAKGSQVLIAPKSLGKAITKTIEDKMEEAEEEGDAEQGNPFTNPYAFKLTYDENEQPTLMYQATDFKAKITKEVKTLLDGDGSDLEPLTRPTPIKDIVEILKDILVVEIEGFDLADWEEKGSKESKGKTVKDSKSNKDSDYSEEELDEMENDELVELAEKFDIEPTYTGKGAKKKLNKKALIEALIEAMESEDSDSDDDDDDDEEGEGYTEEELSELDDKELLEVAEEYEVEAEYTGKGAKKKLNKKALIEAILEAQDSEEDEEGEEPDDEEGEGYTEEELDEMDDKEILEVAEELEIEPEYTGKGAKKKLNKKALIEAILEAQDSEEDEEESDEEGYTEESLEEMDDKELLEVAEELEVEAEYTGKGAKKKLNRKALIEAIIEAQDSEEDEEDEEEAYTEESLGELDETELLEVAESMDVEPAYTGKGAKKKLNVKAVIKAILEAQDSDDDDEDSDDEEEEKKTTKTSKSKKVKVECPSCGKEIDEEDEKCPHCGAEFSGESVIICPDCGAENDETATKCKKCKTELIPF